ncbi:MAG: septal ring lytic transglycosylase RlpA family protein [Rickettsiales bacterium]|nr:septal ring lytic transglycosylase RlpA family protein [Rickettsiales bacterium]
MAYNETGVAGIVPADLTGTTTTNGEVWNGEQLLGTSKVLPLPSIVRVTNLDNGNNVVVRVNNRGPFVNTRIMDVSAAAAKKLGITNQTKVQVQILSSESESVKSETLKSATTTDVPAGAPVVLAGGNGPYMVQVAALASEDNANMLAQRIANMGNVQVQLENGLYKVRILGLDAAGAKSAIENIKNTEGTTPGLLKDGIWVNSDSI